VGFCKKESPNRTCKRAADALSEIRAVHETQRHPSFRSGIHLPVSRQTIDKARMVQTTSTPGSTFEVPKASLELLRSRSDIHVLRNHSEAPDHPTPYHTTPQRPEWLMHARVIRTYEILPVRCAPARCTPMRYMPAVSIPCTTDTSTLSGSYPGRYLIQELDT
jgi:hypothetical protein